MKKKIIPIGIITGILAVAAIVIAVLLQRGFFRVIKVESCQGEVVYERKGSRQDVFEDMNLVSGDVVTTGHDSAVELLADTNKHIVAEEDTCFSIKSRGTSASGKIRIVMQYGTALYAIDKKLNDKSEFEVETPNATLSVRGTVFSVTCDESANTTMVEVTEGKVRAVTETDEVDISAGEKAVIRDDEIMVGEIAAIYDASVGDIITFGTYEQDNDLQNGKEPIEWYVMDRDDEGALLLSVHVLDSWDWDKKDQTVDNITWEKCGLRSWLNDNFYNEAFTKDEQKWIAESYLENRDNPVFGTAGGADTTDRVFLFSLEDIETYFSAEYQMIYEYFCEEGNLRRGIESSSKELIEYLLLDDGNPGLMAHATAYAHTPEYLWSGRPTGTGWWLRSPGQTGEKVGEVFVTYLGRIISGIDVKTAVSNGVRPAVRIGFQALPN